MSKPKKTRNKCPDCFTVDVVVAGLRASRDAGEMKDDIARIKESADPREKFFQLGWDTASEKAALAKYKTLVGFLLLHSPLGIMHKLRIREGLRRFNKEIDFILSKPADRIRLEGYAVNTLVAGVKEAKKNMTSGQRLPKFLKDLTDLMADEPIAAEPTGDTQSGDDTSGDGKSKSLVQSSASSGLASWNELLRQHRSQAGSKRPILRRHPTTDSEPVNDAAADADEEEMSDDPELNDADTSGYVDAELQKGVVVWFCSATDTASKQLPSGSILKAGADDWADVNGFRRFVFHKDKSFWMSEEPALTCRKKPSGAATKKPAGKKILKSTPRKIAYSKCWHATRKEYLATCAKMKKAFSKPQFAALLKKRLAKSSA